MCPGFQCDTLRRAMWGRQDGQTAAEYLGALLVVSVIVAAVATTPVGETIERELQRIVCEIAGGGDCDALGEDEPDGPKPSDCVVAEATDKLTLRGEFDVKLVTVKLDGGVEYTRQKRANGEVAITFKLANNGGVGKRIREYAAAAIRGSSASSVTFLLPDDAAANRFAQQIKDSAKAIAMSPVTRYTGGEEPHVEWPPIETVNVEYGGGASVSAGADDISGYAEGEVEMAQALGYKEDVTEGREQSGERTVYYKVSAKGTAAAGIPLIDEGYTGALAGELTLAVTWDAEGHAKKLSIAGSGAYEHGEDFTLPAKDMKAALQHVDSLRFKHNSRSGKKVEFQIDLDLDDATERELILALVRGANPLPGMAVDKVSAGRRLWALIEREGKIQVRHYKTDASTRSLDVETPLATIGAGYDTTRADLTGAVDYNRGQGFVPSLVCR
jgi:hypothetical protein